MDSEDKSPVVAMLRALRSLAPRFKLGEPQPGDGNGPLAEAPVLGLDEELRSPVLRIRRRSHGITLEVRDVTRRGPRGVIRNLAPSIFLNRFLRPNSGGEFGDTDIAVFGLILDAYVRSPRTVDDLIEAVVLASNDITVRTRAVVDPRDQECYVDLFVPCEPARIPDDLDELVGAVLQHAALIQRFVGIVRRVFQKEHRLSDETLHALLAKVSEQKDKTEVEVGGGALEL